MRCSIHKSSLQTRRPCLRPLPLLMHSSSQKQDFYSGNMHHCQLFHCGRACLQREAVGEYVFASSASRLSRMLRSGASWTSSGGEVKTRCRFHEESLRLETAFLIGCINLDLSALAISARIMSSKYRELQLQPHFNFSLPSCTDRPHQAQLCRRSSAARIKGYIELINPSSRLTRTADRPPRVHGTTLNAPDYGTVVKLARPRPTVTDRPLTSSDLN